MLIVCFRFLHWWLLQAECWEWVWRKEGTFCEGIGLRLSKLHSDLQGSCSSWNSYSETNQTNTVYITLRLCVFNCHHLRLCKNSGRLKQSSGPRSSKKRRLWFVDILAWTLSFAVFLICSWFRAQVGAGRCMSIPSLTINNWWFSIKHGGLIKLALPLLTTAVPALSAAAPALSGLRCRRTSRTFGCLAAGMETTTAERCIYCTPCIEH